MWIEPSFEKKPNVDGSLEMDFDLSLDGGKKKLTAEEEKLLYAKGRRNHWCKEYLHTG